MTMLERQCVKTNKDSDIADDATDWAMKTIEKTCYQVELLLRLIAIFLGATKNAGTLLGLEIQ